jgi:hypothetical protein
VISVGGTTVVDDGADPAMAMLGLVVDVARVLEDHGYERLNGGQLEELQRHLHHFLHGDPERPCEGGAR